MKTKQANILKTHYRVSANIRCCHLLALVICANVRFPPSLARCWIYLCILLVPLWQSQLLPANTTLPDTSHQVSDYLQSLFSWL